MEELKAIGTVLLGALFISAVATAEYLLGIPAEIVLVPNLLIGTYTGLYCVATIVCE